MKKSSQKQLDTFFKDKGGLQIYITEAVEVSVNKVLPPAINKYVNGKIDEIKNHLERQDLMLKGMDEKIKPLDDTKKGAYFVYKFILGFGLLATAIFAIMKFIESIR